MSPSLTLPLDLLTSKMVHCLQFRTSTFLNSEEWRNKPWQHVEKDSQYKLLEFGFELGENIEKLDKGCLQKSADSTQAAIDLMHDFLDLETRMFGWLQDFQAESPHLTSAEGFVEPHRFRNLRFTIIMLTYWALKLVMSHLVALVGGALLQHIPPQMVKQFLGEDIIGVMERHDKEPSLEHARNILRTTPYILDDEMGLMAAQQAMFPLRAALFVLKLLGGEELEWCKAVYAQFNAKKGLRYSVEVGKSDGNYSVDDYPGRRIIPEVQGKVLPSNSPTDSQLKR